MNFKTASAVLLLSLFAVNASAQSPQHKGAQRGGEQQRPTAEKIAEISTDKLDQKLELTDAQEKKIYAINLQYAQQQEAQAAEKKESRPSAEQRKEANRPDAETMKAKREEMVANKKAQMVEIMKILTDEQKVEYALLIGQSSNRRPERSGKMQGKQGGQRGHGQKAPQGKGKGKEQGKGRGEKSAEGQEQSEGRQGGRPQRTSRPVAIPEVEIEIEIAE